MKISVKTICLVSVLSLNAFVMCFTSAVMLNKSKAKKYNVSTVSESENSVTASKYYYEVKKGTLKDYTFYSAVSFYQDSAFITFEVDELNNVSLFDEISEEQVLGKKDGADVLSSVKGKVMSIDSSSGYKVTVFDYASLFIKVSFSYDEYYLADFENGTYAFTYSNKEYTAEYYKVELDNVNSSTINVIFRIENNDIFIPKGEPIEFGKLEKVYENVYYLTGYYDIYTDQEKTFYYDNNGQAGTISLYCVKYLSSGKAIVKGANLTEGLRIYEF